MDELASPKAERALLGSVLMDPACWQRVSHVPASALTDWKRRAVWQTVAEIKDDGKELDWVALADRLEKDGTLETIGGSAYLSSLVSAVPNATLVEQYAEGVLDYALRRDDVRRAEELAKLAHDGTADYAAERARIARSVLSGTTGRLGFVDAAQAAEEAYSEVAYNVDHPLKPGEVRGLPTGLMDLDRLTRGLHSGLYAFAGVTNNGKTAVSLAIAVNAALAGKRVAYFSPEMSPGELMHRAVCARARVTSETIERGNLTPQQLADVTSVYGWLSELPLLMSQETDIGQIESLLYQALPVDLVVIDGVELLTGTRKERTHEQRGELARWAKSLAENPDIKCPVWLPMQISAHSLKHRDDKRPRPGDIYASAEPEMFGDNVMMVHKPSYWDPEDNPHIIEVSYWKTRKKGYQLPDSCSLLLDRYGAVRDLEARNAPPEPYLGGD